jgi:hypothetical protein
LNAFRLWEILEKCGNTFFGQKKSASFGYYKALGLAITQGIDSASQQLGQVVEFGYIGAEDCPVQMD